MCCFGAGLLIDRINQMSALIAKSIESNEMIDFSNHYFEFNGIQRKAIRHFVNNIIPDIESKIIEKDVIISELQEELNSLKLNDRRVHEIVRRKSCV